MSVEEYLRRPYARTLRIDEDGDVVARVLELPGCLAHGASAVEALEALDEVMRAWVEERLEAGLQIPEPEPEVDLPSGKWLQRVPRSLHAKLVSLAKRDGVSLNQFVTSLLAEAVGAKTAFAVPAEADKWKDICHLWRSGSSWAPGTPERTQKTGMAYLRLLTEHLPHDLVTLDLNSVWSIYGEEAKQHKSVQRVPAEHRALGAGPDTLRSDD